MSNPLKQAKNRK
jgi:hypothetical protein